MTVVGGKDSFSIVIKEKFFIWLDVSLSKKGYLISAISKQALRIEVLFILISVVNEAGKVAFESSVNSALLARKIIKSGVYAKTLTQ